MYRSQIASKWNSLRPTPTEAARAQEFQLDNQHYKQWDIFWLVGWQIVDQGEAKKKSVEAGGEKLEEQQPSSTQPRKKRTHGDKLG